MLCLSRSLSVVKCVSGGMRWLFLTARTPYPLEWVREQSPLHMAAADVGLVSCEWEGILYPRLPLMWGWYHVNEKVSSTHGRRWCGAGIMWMRRYPLPTAAADVGLVSCEWEGILYPRLPLMWVWFHVNESVLYTRQTVVGGLVLCEWVMSQVIVFCTRQNAALRWGAACLDSEFFRATWEPLAPVSALSSQWKGDVRSRADV